MICKNCQKEIGQKTSCHLCGYDPVLGEKLGPSNSMAYNPPKPVSIVLKKTTNGMAIASLVLSFLVWVPICGPLSVLFGIIGFFKAKSCRSGRAMSVIALLINLLWVVGIVAFYVMIYMIAMQESGAMM